MDINNETLNTTQIITENTEPVNSFNVFIDDLANQAVASGLYENEPNELREFIMSRSIHADPLAGFSINSWPPIYKEYINDLATQTEAHKVMISASFLAMMSSFMAKNFKIGKGPNGTFEDLYSNIWIMCLAKSGQFKTTALNLGSELAIKSSNLLKKEIQAKREALKGHKEGTQEHTDLLRTIEELKRADPLFPNKITPEALIESLAFGHGRLFLHSEAAGWLAEIDRLGLKELFTELYGSAPSYTYRTLTRGDVVIQDPFISIVGVSNLAWMKDRLQPSDIPSGFFPRFFFLYIPESDTIPASGPRFLPQTYSNNREIKEHMWQLIKTLKVKSGQTSYTLSDEAHMLHNVYHDDLYKLKRMFLPETQELLDPYVRRWSEALKKVAQIMQVGFDHTANVISAQAMKAALSFIAPIVRSTIYILEAELMQSKEEEYISKIYAFIKRLFTEHSEPVIYKKIRDSKIIKNRETGFRYRYEELLDALIERGMIIKIPNQSKELCAFMPKS